MGDPSDFRLGGPRHPIPKELWGCLSDMTDTVDRLLTKCGDRLEIAELKAKEKELAKAIQILTKYRDRVKSIPTPKALSKPSPAGGREAEVCEYTPTGWAQHPRKEWLGTCGLRAIRNYEIMTESGPQPGPMFVRCMKCKRPVRELAESIPVGKDSPALVVECLTCLESPDSEFGRLCDSHYMKAKARAALKGENPQPKAGGER